MRALRLARGIQNGALAREIGITHSHLANIEAGRKRCSAALAVRVAKALDVPLPAITTCVRVDAEHLLKVTEEER